MADKDGEVPPATPVTGSGPGRDPDVATGGAGPDVPQDVESTNDPDRAAGDDDLADAIVVSREDEPAPVVIGPDAGTDGRTDGRTDAGTTRVGEEPDVAAHLDQPAEPAESEEPAAAWFTAVVPPVPDPEPDVDPTPQPTPAAVGEPASVPAPVVEEPVVEEPVVEPPVVAEQPVTASTPEWVHEPLPDVPAPAVAAAGPAPAERPSFQYLGTVEHDTTIITLRSPADLVREHRRRERRRTLTFLGIFLGVVGMGAASFMVFQGRWAWPFGAQKVSAPLCPTPTTTVLAPSDVVVKVYNASTRKGLAKSISAVLKKRGFTIDAVGNDPEESKVAGAAVVRHGPDGLDAAKTVAAQIDGKVDLVDDGRVSQSVDLVLGTKWTKFRTPAAAAKVLAPAAPSSPAGCVPAAGSDSPSGTPSGSQSGSPSGSPSRKASASPSAT